ncbi:hypothetical protein BGX38DRAFT_1186956 [Terfezia claveryi]|nr:hypothetical protein BGX38DRAFT_1186956 [Terfezia claveryi]
MPALSLLCTLVTCMTCCGGATSEVSISAGVNSHHSVHMNCTLRSSGLLIGRKACRFIGVGLEQSMCVVPERQYLCHGPGATGPQDTEGMEVFIYPPLPKVPLTCLGCKVLKVPFKVEVH